MNDTASRQLPSRVVDARHYGWLRTGDGPDTYSADYHWPSKFADRPKGLSYAELESTHGPLREVVPPSAESVAELRRVIREAGTKAVGSLLVAISQLSLDFALRPGKPEISGSLVAGREGSWEAERLYSLSWSLGLTLADRPKRFDQAAVDGFKAVLLGWVTGEDYTEVAETLAGVFSDVADDLGGWKAVADGPFQPGGRFSHDFGAIEAVHSWLLSRTEDDYQGLSP